MLNSLFRLIKEKEIYPTWSVEFSSWSLDSLSSDFLYFDVEKNLDIE